MAVTPKNGLNDEQLRKLNTDVANKALESLQNGQTTQKGLQTTTTGGTLQIAQPTASQTSGIQNAGINTKYGYTPSQSVLNAYDYLQKIINGKPGEYQSRYKDQLQGMMDQIMNRDPFEYDANADPLFQIYQDQYILGGQRAMQDAMGQAAALTGGYGNSYAQSVGQQTYNQYMENLMGIIPELSQMAYERYQDEGEALERNYSMLNQLENQDYNRYRDIIGDWQTERQMAENTYNTERGFDYGSFSDKRTYDQQQEQFAKQMALQEAQLQLQRDQFEWQKAQAAARSRGGGGGRRTSNNPQTQTAEEIQKNANNFIGNLYTKQEYARHNSGGTKTNYDQYVANKVEQAYNTGKLSQNEALAVLDYYAKR